MSLSDILLICRVLIKILHIGHLISFIVAQSHYCVRYLFANISYCPFIIISLFLEILFLLFKNFIIFLISFLFRNFFFFPFLYFSTKKPRRRNKTQQHREVNKNASTRNASTFSSECCKIFFEKKIYTTHSRQT